MSTSLEPGATPSRRSRSPHDRSQIMLVDEREAFGVLVDLAQGRMGALPAEVAARHVLAVTAGADWPVQRAALEALLRRVGFARRDELQIASRPPERRPLGIFTTRARGSAGPRPYRTLLTAVDPPAGSCDCPDYLRGSLGLCKHLLCALDWVHVSPRRLARALEVQAGAAAAAAQAGPHLGWDPVRPLTGEGDWLERARWRDGAVRRGRPGAALIAARRWFRVDGEGGESWRPVQPRALAPEARPEVVRDLHRFVVAAGRGSPWSADPALRPLLEAEQARLERLEQGVDLVKRLPRALRSLEKRLYPYQVEGVRRFLACGRLLLADDMGLGKTAQAIAACHVLWNAGRVERGLLVVPASLKPQWLREWRLFSDVPVQIVEGSPAQRQELFRRCRRGFLIANYEQVLRDLLVMHAWRPDLVVLDEAQRIKNWATKTATYIKRLQPAYRLVLTGTPMENRLEELASIIDWVDDQALEPKWRLGPWHAVAIDGGVEVGGARNLDTLRTRIAGSLVRRLRQEVLDQLPPRTDTRVGVPLTPEQLEEHHALDQPIASLVQRAKRRPLAQAEFLRLMTLLTTQRIICNGLAQLRFEEVWPSLGALRRPGEATLKSLFCPKLLELRELVASLVVTQQRKVVVFSQWRRMLRLASWAISDLLEEEGLRAVFFTGAEGPRRRTQNLVDLHDDPATRVLFASDAGGVGLNLQRAASCCINLELPWNPAVLEQRVGRIYRLGQRSPIEVYHLVSEGGIEGRIAELVGDKRALFTGLFDGGSDEVRFDHSGSFLSRIEKVIEPVGVPELAGGAAEDEDAASAADDEDAASAAQELAAEERLEEVSTEASALANATPVAAHVAAHVAVGGLELGALLSRISIRPTGDGGVTIEAPREAAAAMATILEGLARQLAASASTAPSPS